MTSYCLFCNTTRCGLIAELLQQRLNCEAISPKIVQRKWVKGQCFEEKKDYLPGYVFLYAREPLPSLREAFSIDGVIRFLGEKDDGYRLRGEDERFAAMLYENEGTIGIMKAYRVGDRIRLVDSAFSGLAGEILRVDRRKGRAEVCIRFDEKDFHVWVGFDVIGTLPENTESEKKKESETGHGITK